jgi:hypothetical protein
LLQSPRVKKKFFKNLFIGISHFLDLRSKNSFISCNVWIVLKHFSASHSVKMKRAATQQSNNKQTSLHKLLCSAKGPNAIWLASCIVDAKRFLLTASPICTNIIEAATLTGRFAVIESFNNPNNPNIPDIGLSPHSIRNKVYTAKQMASRAERFLKEIGRGDHPDAEWIDSEIIKPHRVSLLFRACSAGKPLVLDSCISYIGMRKVIRMEDRDGHHPLFLAAQGNHVPTAALLMKRGFPVYHRCKDGEFPHGGLAPDQLDMQTLLFEAKPLTMHDEIKRGYVLGLALERSVKLTAYVMTVHLLEFADESQKTSLKHTLHLLGNIPFGSKRMYSDRIQFYEGNASFPLCSLPKTMEALLSMHSRFPHFYHQDTLDNLLMSAAGEDQVRWIKSSNQRIIQK